ncbi:integrase [Candidatus Gottesmanbacteria bacterium]|nr:integrase [Candidatus Gottesmanbacteria bacterium]
MEITMDDSLISNVTQIREFLKGSIKFDLSLRDAEIERKYEFIDKTVDRLKYGKLPKRDKKVVIKYLRKITGYKKRQLIRLISQAVIGELKRQPYKRVHPHKIYTSSDIKILEKTDELHIRLSEGATKEILRREFEIFHHNNFQTISRISHSHITNLRHSLVYSSHWVNHTKARIVPIGITMPPENFGCPGSIRVDVVHQRDVYHINSVDEITQWEIVVCVPQISESCMVPALQEMIDQYPFIIFNFHSDRGGENINYQVSYLLEKERVKQTKSRSNHCNDNALVETKNGSVIRKNMGWQHINQNLADKVNEYYRNYFNPYLNYHRPCAFPTIITDEKGRKKRMYHSYLTPYEALKAVTEPNKFLKPDISFEKLDIIAYQYSDNEFAEILRNEERKLFDLIAKENKNGGSLEI